MKKVLVFVLATVLTLGAAAEKAAAQKFELGARAGTGSQNMALPESYRDAKTRLGWNLAAVSRIRIVGLGDGLIGAGLYFQPEVVYSQSKIKSEYISGDEASRSKIKMETVDVPLLLSLKVSIARVQAGPVFSLMNNFRDGDMEFKTDRSPVGYAVGASVDLLGLTIDGRYHGDFKTMNFKGVENFKDFKSRFSSWSLGVGLMF